jgi:hypothetical protein
MKRILCGLLVAALAVIASTAAAAPAPDVVIIACAGPGPLLVVTESSSSAGAPVVANGTPCAQAVADLLAARMRLVGVSSPGVGVIYTFTGR